MPDFFGMMKRSDRLKSKMQAVQDQLNHVEVDGFAGEGLVVVRMTAKMEIRGVKIDPSLIKAEEREILEDLLVAAFGDAVCKAETVIGEKMEALVRGSDPSLN